MCGLEHRAREAIGLCGLEHLAREVIGLCGLERFYMKRMGFCRFAIKERRDVGLCIAFFMIKKERWWIEYAQDDGRGFGVLVEGWLVAEGFLFSLGWIEEGLFRVVFFILPRGSLLLAWRIEERSFKKGGAILRIGSVIHGKYLYLLHPARREKTWHLWMLVMYVGVLFFVSPSC